MLGPSSRPDIASPLTGSIWPYRRRLCSRNTVLRSSQGRWFIFDVDVSPRRSTSVLGACGLSALHAPSRYPVLKVPAAAPVAPVPCGKGIYCQTPAAAGAGIGASTECTQLGRLLLRVLFFLFAQLLAFDQAFSSQSRRFFSMAGTSCSVCTWLPSSSIASESRVNPFQFLRDGSLLYPMLCPTYSKHCFASIEQKRAAMGRPALYKLWCYMRLRVTCY